MISNVQERICILRQNMEVGKLYDKRFISKLFGLCDRASTLDAALAEITFLMPELFETDNGKLGINHR